VEIMAGIGDDIKTVLAELGSPITIYKPNGTIVTGEFIDYDTYYDQSTEFIRQNCYAGDFSYDTQTDFGDIILVSGVYLLVLNRKPTYFEQEPVIDNCFMVETNCYGHFARQVSTRVNMEKHVTWPTTVSNIRGLQIENFRDPLTELAPSMKVASAGDDLYIPKIANIKVGDRWYPDSTVTTDYFKVANIITRSFKNCFKIKLDADTRE
jgi:hypothetical protein